MSERIDMIRKRLTAAFSPEQLDIIDESHLHAGHPGARSGGGHFVATIVSEAFAGKNMLERHRMVYDALGDAMQTEIHALSIKAYTPQEIQNQ
jgi:BolA protein